ncbi:MAG: hypothetical protein WDN48_16965 [Pseudolabrys sp.]
MTPKAGSGIGGSGPKARAARRIAHADRCHTYQSRHDTPQLLCGHKARCLFASDLGSPERFGIAYRTAANSAGTGTGHFRFRSAHRSAYSGEKGMQQPFSPADERDQNLVTDREGRNFLRRTTKKT